MAGSLVSSFPEWSGMGEHGGTAALGTRASLGLGRLKRDLAISREDVVAARALGSEGASKLEMTSKHKLSHSTDH